MGVNHRDAVVGQFLQQAEGYSRLTNSMAGDRQAALRNLLQPGPEDTVLDVCCGPGLMALDFAPHVRRVIGLDLTAAMLEQAKAAQAKRGVANAEWIEGDALDMPFADSAFSIVHCGSAFHHLTAPRVALAEMVRVAASGARVAVKDVTPHADKSTAYDAMEKLRDPSHTHALTIEELSKLGDGLPVGAPAMSMSITADLPLDAVLATSFPESCTVDEIRARFMEDARSGKDQLGFSAKLIDGAVRVSYRVSTAIWIKH